MPLLLPLAAALAFINGPLRAQVPSDQSSPMEITTDTPEYCQELVDRMSELIRVAQSPVPQRVGDLTTEGHRMCDKGQTRGGIMRLRTALMLMEQGEPHAHQ